MFLSLVSGSSGNATLITDEQTTILIDCGLSGKKLEAAFASIGRSPKELDAILVTHEHIDHTAGVGVVSRRFDVPVYATAGTYRGMSVGKLADKNIHTIAPEHSFEIGTIGVCPFSISHDANDPVGFSFFVNHKKVSLATDTGTMTDSIKQHILGSEAVILESNHDVDMLLYGSYPYSLKQRILSERGHLSNDDCAKTAVELLQSGTRHILLGHLSNENNTPEIAFRTAVNALRKAGAAIDSDVRLGVARRYEATAVL